MNDLADAKETFRFLLDASLAVKKQSAKGANGSPLFGSRSELRELFGRCRILAADYLLRDPQATPIDARVGETISGIVVGLYVLAEPIWKKASACDFAFRICRSLVEAAGYRKKIGTVGQKGAFFREVTSRSTFRVQQWILDLK